MQLTFFSLSLLFLYSFSSITAHSQSTGSPEELIQNLNQSIKGKKNDKAAFYAYELAKIAEDAHQLTKAKEYLEQSAGYAKKASDNSLLFLTSDRLGSILLDEKNYTKAQDQFQRSVKSAELLANKEFIAQANMNLGKAYASSGKYKKAVEPIGVTASIARQLQNQTLEQACYELLASYYAKLGDKQKQADYTTLRNNIIQQQVNAEQNVIKREALEATVSETNTIRQQTATQLATQKDKLIKQNDKLLQVEDSLMTTRYTLSETTDSLKAVEAVKAQQQLEIDLLSKDKELNDMKFREQAAELKNQVLIRNTVIAGIVFAAAIVLVLIVGYRRKMNDNKKIDLQNKSIRSSINYAKRIQQAMLHKADQHLAAIPESFILFKPRDSVSGDFYWFSEIKSWYNPDLAFAAVDCTGHGVPGAFMSMIGINSLNSIISHGVAETNQILDALDQEVKTALQQEKTGNNDGMDIALCIYRKEKNVLEFSGAKNPLVYIQDGELNIIKGDNQSIGGSQNKNTKPFKKHLIPLEETTMIYLFSDGYRDQFGGNDNSKYMSKRFQKLLFDIHEKPLTEQKELLDQEIESWKGTYPQTDDILVMGIRIEPTNIV